MPSIEDADRSHGSSRRDPGDSGGTAGLAGTDPRVGCPITVAIAPEDEILGRLMNGHRARLAFAATLAGGDRSGHHSSEAAVARTGRNVFVSAVNLSMGVEAQVATLRSISPARDRDFLIFSTVGGLFAPVPDRARLLKASDAEFSLAMGSLVAAGLRFEPKALEDAIARQEGLFADAVIRRLGSRVRCSPFEELEARLGARSGLGPVDLDGVLQTANAAKHRLLEVVGPDPFSIVQGLCDPRCRFDERRLNAAAAIMDRWGLARLFVALLVFRLTGSYVEEAAFVRKNASTLFAANMSLKQRMKLDALLAEGPARPAGRTRDAFATRLLDLLAALRWAIASSRPDAVTDRLIDLYCLEPRAIGFLDWRAVFQVLQTNDQTSTARTAFVTLLMNDETVRRRFPDVALATGTGALVSELIALIDPRRRTDALTPLLNRFQSLPRRAATALAAALVERPIVERITGALPIPVSWPRELPEMETTRPTLVRLELLRSLVKRGLMSKEAADVQTMVEVERLRIDYFRSRMRSGRVPIDWRGIEATARHAVETDLEPLRVLSEIKDRRRPQAVVLEQLARFAVGRLAGTVLYDSDRSIDQALSDNLRHGVISPRILRAFDDAFHTTFPARRSLPIWDEDGVGRDLGAHFQQIATLREAVAIQMKRFNDEWLTVEPDGEFAAAFAKVMVACVLRLADRPAGWRNLPVAIRRIVRWSLRGQLVLAVARLRGAECDLLMADLLSTRSQMAGAGPGIARFLDTLETNLHGAVNEAAGWIGIATADSSIIPFKLSEVVKLDLLSFSFAAWDRLKVRTRCSSFSEAEAVVDPAISGRHLEAIQEVVHNLLSNAFKHSGFGLETEVLIELREDVHGRLVIRSANSVSDKRFPIVCREHAETLRLARIRSDAQARRDEVSGFQKVRKAMSRDFGAEPLVNIPPPSARTKRYIVEVSVPCPANLFEP